MTPPPNAIIPPAADMAQSFAATITKSANPYLSYPCSGRFQVLEAFLDGSIRVVFQPGEYRGCQFFASGGPVVLRSPEFTYPAFTQA